MRRILTLTISALVLAGCADTDGYDRAAIPNARTATRVVMEGCDAKLVERGIKSNAAYASCSMTAERGYFTAIKLKNMASFDTYATSYLTLAADLDANRISKKRAGIKAREMLRQFYVACDCQHYDGFGPISAPGGSYYGTSGNSLSGTIPP